MEREVAVWGEELWPREIRWQISQRAWLSASDDIPGVTCFLPLAVLPFAWGDKFFIRTSKHSNHVQELKMMALTINSLDGQENKHLPIDWSKKEITSEPLRLEFSAPVHSLWLRTESLDFGSLYVEWGRATLSLGAAVNWSSCNVEMEGLIETVLIFRLDG